MLSKYKEANLLYFIETIEFIHDHFQKAVEHSQKGNKEYFHLTMGFIHWEIKQLYDKGNEILEEIEEEEGEK